MAVGVAVTRRLVRQVAVIRVDWPLLVLDAAVAALAYVGVLFVRFEGRIPASYGHWLLALVPVVVIVHLAANAANGLYGCVWQQAGVEEARNVVVGGVTATALLVSIDLALDRPLPLSVPLLGSGLVMLLVGVSRFQGRVFGYRRRHTTDGEPLGVVVVGAGPAGGTLVREMLATVDRGLRPVAVVDDAPGLAGRRLGGVPVLGGPNALDEAVHDHGAVLAVLARPDATGRDVARWQAASEAAGIPLKVLPSLAELAGSPARVRDVRDIQIQDLLGRTQVSESLDDVRRILAGRRVLITGAGGSIGSEIARQVAALRPARLVLLDHDETHLHDTAAALEGAVELVLADIRDRRRVDEVVGAVRPEVVFHAAAHKHVPMLEAHPCEAVATNVGGTDNVLRAAARHDVERVVFVSTDKAVQPSSVMGATKRMGEQLLLAHRPAGRPWAAVRFGNVLGSRGSVVPTFVRQIRAGGPVTVTHPEMTRFFMSIPEAVQLVLHATAMSDGGEVFMLDMGDPVRIVDLAERMIEMSGAAGTVDVVFTGLRPGEKLAEVLREPEEVARPTPHPAVLALEPLAVDADALGQAVARLFGLAAIGDDDHVARVLFDHVRGRLPRRTDDVVITLPDVPTRVEVGR